MQIGLNMEAGDWPKLNMNAMENYLLSHSLDNCLHEFQWSDKKEAFSEALAEDINKYCESNSETCGILEGLIPDNGYEYFDISFKR